MGYVCTHVIFQPAGVGYAGLENGPQYAFTWQQQQASLTITYQNASDKTRLEAGVYTVKHVAIPRRHQQPASTELQLRTAQGETHFLERALR
jgi:hypothetical protein